MRIVYMGTPEFAVAGLDALKKAGHDIAAVVTATDKPAGRGQKLSPSAVKSYAMEHSIPVLQPEKLRDPEFLHQLKALNAELFVVVAFRMLPDVVWKMPARGTINLHASLLPAYRGAAPINHAVINGEKETGVTTFFIREEIDTGNVIDQQKVPILDHETAGDVHDKLMHTGAELLVKTLSNIEAGTIRPIAQEELSADIDSLPTASKIFRNHCEIDWNLPAEKIRNLIRGMSPYPAAFTTMRQPGKEDVLIKIFRAEHTSGSVTPGEVESDGKSYLKVKCGEGCLALTELQQAGKKRMGIEEYLRGTRIESGARMVKENQG